VPPVGGFVDASVNVLLAADDEDIRMLLRITMRADPRFRVTGEAASADDALALLAEADPALIVLDRHLGGIQTITEVAAGLRAAAPTAKILLLTAFAPDAASAESGAIDCCLRKSEIRLLLPTARRLLDLPTPG